MPTRIILALMLGMLVFSACANDDLAALRTMADQGDAEAQLNLGVMYSNGRGVPQNDKEAVRWYRLAADQGHVEAQYGLGFMYSNGRGVPQNHTLAHMWYNLAASKLTGDDRDTAINNRDRVAKEMTPEAIAEAQRLASEWKPDEPPLITDEEPGFIPDTLSDDDLGSVEDLSSVRVKAEQGNAEAQNNLGNIYRNGGVPGDYKEALKWYRKSAEQGNADAQNNLGVMYHNGEGVPVDYKTALKWFRLAAEQGNASAQGFLGVAYGYGQGVPQDDKTAVKWYRLAAEQGDMMSQGLLGVMYENGKGVPQDLETAVKWWRLSAEQGNAVAQYHLEKHQIQTSDK